MRIAWHRVFCTLAVFSLLATVHGSGATFYVDLNSTNPAPPFTTWSTAATNIQDAVDAASVGDTVMVTNGVYLTGARTVPPNMMTNLLVVTNGIAVQSVNGPSVTTIEPYVSPFGGGPLRCVYLANGSTLSGFTLANGEAESSVANTNDENGGGAWCESTNETISNCVFSNNQADGCGGAVFGGTLNRCTLQDNFAGQTGGGAFGSALDNCVLDSNFADSGGGAGFGTLNDCTVAENEAFSFSGGVDQCVLNNSIVYSNICANQPNYSADAPASTLNYCCTTPAAAGPGNITNVPLFLNPAAGNFPPANYRLAVGSPCVDAGNNLYAAGPADLDGHPRIVDGTVDMGAYEFEPRYVNQSGAHPLAPYSSWATAATNIQDAVDVAVDYDVVLVTNGLYQAGGRAVPPYMLTNRVVVTNNIIVQSVNGPSVTIIQGQMAQYSYDPIELTAPGFRCVYLADGASLVGFTLTGGDAYPASSINAADLSGGGLWAESASDVVSRNCVIVSNAASDGGGAFGGTLNNCAISGNSGGSGCGVSHCLLNDCTVTGNIYPVPDGAVFVTGGGAYFSTLNNCLRRGKFPLPGRRRRILPAEQLHDHQQHGLQFRRRRL